MENNKPKPTTTNTEEIFFGMSFVFNFGFVILVPALLGIFGGKFLDAKFNTRPILTLTFLILGILIGGWSGVRQIQSFLLKSKQISEQAKLRRQNNQKKENKDKKE